MEYYKHGGGAAGSDQQADDVDVDADADAAPDGGERT
jgi:hypothetical protein